MGTNEVFYRGDLDFDYQDNGDKPMKCMEPDEATLRFKNPGTFLPPFATAAILFVVYLIDVLRRINYFKALTPDMTIHETMIYMFLANGIALILSHRFPDDYPWCDSGRSFTNASVSSLCAAPIVASLMLVYDTVFRATWIQTNNGLAFATIIVYMGIAFMAGFAMNFISAMQASALTTDGDVSNYVAAAWFTIFLTCLLSYSCYYLFSLLYNWMYPDYMPELMSFIPADNSTSVSASASASHSRSYTPTARSALPPLPPQAVHTPSTDSTGSDYANQLMKENKGATSVSAYKKVKPEDAAKN